MGRFELNLNTSLKLFEAFFGTLPLEFYLGQSYYLAVYFGAGFSGYSIPLRVYLKKYARVYPSGMEYTLVTNLWSFLKIIDDSEN